MASPAYHLSRVATIGPINALWHVMHTNTTASVDNADFLVADAASFKPGDIVIAVKVDDLDKVGLGTAVVSGASGHVVITASATAVDLSNTLFATYTDAD